MFSGFFTVQGQLTERYRWRLVLAPTPCVARQKFGHGATNRQVQQTGRGVPAVFHYNIASLERTYVRRLYKRPTPYRILLALNALMHGLCWAGTALQQQNYTLSSDWRLTAQVVQRRMLAYTGLVSATFLWCHKGKPCLRLLEVITYSVYQLGLVYIFNLTVCNIFF